METKWIVLIVLMGWFMVLAVDRYTGNQCKIAYVQSGKSADEIVKLCGK